MRNAENDFDVIVIGAGAAGLMAAGRAAELGARTLLVEKNGRAGVKLSITGKGRCNLTNIAEIKEFIGHFGRNGKFLFGAFSRFFSEDLVEFFRKNGVETKVERGGRVFPVSDDAAVIVGALKRYCERGGVSFLFNKTAADIIINNGCVSGVNVFGDLFKAGAVIIATGGVSYPGTGSTGDGVVFARKLGHKVSPLKPALVPVETREKFVYDLSGLTLKNISIACSCGDKPFFEEFGDILFTHFGLSGPLILKASASVYDHTSAGKNVGISINLKPALDKETIDRRLIRELDAGGTKLYKNVLRNLLPESMIPVFVRLSGIEPDKVCSQISSLERKKILTLLTDFRLEVKRVRPIEEAIITRGGVILDEVNPKTMESKKVKGVYFAGELLDIDGLTGGYNLQAAFSTGFVAGERASIDSTDKNN